jgi:hypothetical protein
MTNRLLTYFVSGTQTLVNVSVSIDWPVLFVNPNISGIAAPFSPQNFIWRWELKRPVLALETVPATVWRRAWAPVTTGSVTQLQLVTATDAPESQRPITIYTSAASDAVPGIFTPTSNSTWSANLSVGSVIAASAATPQSTAFMYTTINETLPNMGLYSLELTVTPTDINTSPWNETVKKILIHII